MRVRQLIHAGWEIDAHTFTHPDLRGVDSTRLRREVTVSRRWLQRTYGIPVPAFCYPFGLYDARTVAEVRRAGYLVAGREVTSVVIGRPSAIHFARPPSSRRRSLWPKRLKTQRA